MNLIADLLIAGIALLHTYICWFEMFAWETRGPKAFPGDPEKFTLTKDMAFNQGAYNGFLAAGLVWALLIDDAIWADRVAFFFLGCVAVAGVVGALSVSKRILAIQTAPAVLAICWLCSPERVLIHGMECPLGEAGEASNQGR